MKSPEHWELLPICTLAGILAGFVAYLIFAPDVLPTVIGACFGVLMGLVFASLDEAPAQQPPTEFAEDSFLRLLTFRD